MIELKIIKEQYQRMPDDELIRFAENESKNLTIDSFHLLKAEFEIRNLDLHVIESAQVDRELAEATKLSSFEKETAIKFEETIWKFAFDEKEKGKANGEIFNSLLRKNISEECAYMLIESIESSAKEQVEHFDIQIIVGWILIVCGCAFFFLMLNSAILPNIAIWGILLAVGGIIRLFVCYNKKRKFQTILNNIEDEKDIETKLYQ
jgi:hypothetical protein